jgi:hypothetical protein
MKRYLLVLLCLYPILAQADIYKAVDADGHVTYSSTPIKGGKKIILEPLPTMAPAGFPKVDAATQKGRDDTRFMILQNELAAEEKLLAAAKQGLAEAEADPEVSRGQDGKTYRNVAKYDEKIKSLQEEVGLHEKNIEALKTELSKLK